MISLRFLDEALSCATGEPSQPLIKFQTSLSAHWTGQHAGATKAPSLFGYPALGAGPCPTSASANARRPLATVFQSAARCALITFVNINSQTVQVLGFIRLRRITPPTPVLN